VSQAHDLHAAPGHGSAPGLYIHIPFCARVCPYCDFAVQTGGPRRRRSFIDSLLLEIELWSKRMPGEGGATEPGSAPRAARDHESPPKWRSKRPFDTVYLGGGTPSSLPVEDLDEVLTCLRGSLPVARDAEVTLEANPEDVNTEKLVAWGELGIDNLSMGIQSFDPAALEFLGRAHTPEMAAAALEAALGSSFKTVSLDLIFALPDQSEEGWKRDLEHAIELCPDHISCYELTIHEGTRFSRLKERGILREPGEDERVSLFFLTHEVLADHGYEAYEVSNFARAPEHRSVHNRKYWDHAAYLGLGPSAHSFDGAETRWWNVRRLPAWEAALSPVEGAAGGENRDSAGGILRVPVAGSENLTAADLVIESLALGLRTTPGVDLDRIKARYGIDLLALNRDLIADLSDAGLVKLTPPGTSLVPTLRGLALADALARSFTIPS
jgi:oxygen-independent coproporphyrinogen-3 oxidase